MLRHQNIQFVFKERGFARLGQCPAEIRPMINGKFMVIFTEISNSGSGAIEPFIESIASQFWVKHLRSVDPQSTHWIIRSPGTVQNEDSYRKVQLTWNGKRFSTPRPMARFNRAAFLSVIGEKN